MSTHGPLTTGVLDQETHQGFHGENLVRSLVVAAGLEISRPEPAIGKDYYIGCPGPRSTIKSPQILVSVKSWRSPQLGEDGCWHYALSVANYNFLAQSRDIRPFLFLAIVPDEVTAYSHATHEALLLRSAVYWLSFEGVTPLGDGDPTSTKTVLIPKMNLLTATTITDLVEGNEMGGR